MPTLNREPPRDERLGHVTFYSKDGKVPTVVKNLISEQVPRSYRQHTSGAGGCAIVDGEFLRLRADFYVHTGQDSAKVQRAAARVVPAGSYGAISLSPASAAWLAGVLQRRASDGHETTICVRGGAW